MSNRTQGVSITCSACKTDFVRPFQTHEMIVACPTCRGLFTVTARDLKAALLRMRNEVVKPAV